MKVILEVQVDTNTLASEGIIRALEPVGEGRGTHYRLLNLDYEDDRYAYKRALAILHAQEQDAPRTASMRVDEQDA